MNQTFDGHPGSWQAPATPKQDGRLAEPEDAARRAARTFARALDQACLDLPDDVERRLAFARQVALQHVRVGAPSSPESRELSTWQHRTQSMFSQLQKWSHILPALALLLGLLTTSHLIEKRNVAAAAAIDAALLNDELPPEAYADAGFVEFLKRGHGTHPEVGTSEGQPASPPAE